MHGAAVNLSAEGNETPLRIRVSRPVGIKVPDNTPTPTTYEILGLRVATIRHIPAALQEHWSRVQAAILDAFCTSPSELLLWGLVAMPKLVLRITRTRGKNAANHQQELIRSRLHQFEQGEWHTLWATLKAESAAPEGPETRSAKRARTEVHATNSAAVRRAQQCLAEGSPGKALQQLTSPGLHDPRDPGVWEKLRQLHPPGAPVTLDALPADITLDLGDQDPQAFWEPLVKDAISSFPRSSAPGPSGLRTSHLQDALRRPGRGAPLISAIARFCHMWAHGLIPEDMAPVLCGANLTPLRKKDGGVRPIAVGEVLRRLACKTLLNTAVAKEETSALAPEQVGVGVSRGAESVALGFDGLLSCMGPHTKSWAALQVDVSAAFPTVSRQHALQETSTDAPSLYNAVKFCLSRSSPIYCGGKILYAETGVPQGCPLSPVVFSLAIQPIIRTISRSMGLIWNVWYLDDGLLVGDPQKLGDALAYLEGELRKRGLSLNRKKCVLWGPAAALVPHSEGIPSVPWEPDSGITLLGAPIPFPGSTGHLAKEWKARLDLLEETTAVVTALADKQLAHHLLRHCLDGCKVTYLFRVTDPYCVPEQTSRANDIVLSAFEDLVGCALSQSQRDQASLPLSTGGCGLKSPRLVQPAARIAALLAFLGGGCANVDVPTYARTPSSTAVAPVLDHLVELLGPQFESIQQWQGRHDLLATSDPSKWHQKHWTDAIGKATMMRLLDSATPRDQARLLEQTSGLGTAWMSVKPSAPLRTIISSEDYTLALKWWLGLPLFHGPEEERTCPGCGRPCDLFGDHLLCCARNNFSRRHNAVQEAIANLLQASGQGFTTEAKIPDCPDGELRPADILLSSFQDGCPTALDLTVAHGWQSSERFSVTRERWRTFLKRKEALKHSKYDAPCKAAGWGFLAMSFGTWGGMGPEGARVLHRLAKRAASWQEGELRSLRQSELLENVGLALLRQVWKLLANKNHLFR